MDTLNDDSPADQQQTSAPTAVTNNHHVSPDITSNHSTSCSTEQPNSGEEVSDISFSVQRDDQMDTLNDDSPADQQQTSAPTAVTNNHHVSPDITSNHSTSCSTEQPNSGEEVSDISFSVQRDDVSETERITGIDRATTEYKKELERNVQLLNSQNKTLIDKNNSLGKQHPNGSSNSTPNDLSNGPQMPYNQNANPVPAALINSIQGRMEVKGTSMELTSKEDDSKVSDEDLSFSRKQGRGNISLGDASTSVATTLSNNYKLLLRSLAQRLLSDDIINLKNWANQKFSIDTSGNATNILFKLGEDGVINASDLDQLRDFFESIVRIDLVYIIDAFLLGDYSLLEQPPTSRKRVVDRNGPRCRQSRTTSTGFPNAVDSSSPGPSNIRTRSTFVNEEAKNSSAAKSTFQSNVERNLATSRKPQKQNGVQSHSPQHTNDAASPNFSTQPSSNVPTTKSPNGARNQVNGGDEDGHWLCSHYKRRCYVKFECCDKFWPCHRCHNNQSTCGRKKLKSRDTKMVKCVNCDKVQQFGQFCCDCNTKFANYYCGLCKHLTGEDDHPYHCDKCGICRIHGDRSFHCDICGVCLDVQLRGNHKCREGSAHDECCICLEDAFTGCQVLPCSHRADKTVAVTNKRRTNEKRNSRPVQETQRSHGPSLQITRTNPETRSTRPAARAATSGVVDEDQALTTSSQRSEKSGSNITGNPFMKLSTQARGRSPNVSSLLRRAIPESLNGQHSSRIGQNMSCPGTNQSLDE